MSAIEWVRGLFHTTPTEPLPQNIKPSSREDDATASHQLHAVVHEVTTTSRAASRTLCAKAAGLAHEARLTREFLTSFPPPEHT